MKKFLSFIALVVLTAVFMFSGVAHSDVCPTDAMDLEGALDGVPYKIRIPAGWDGETLVVYAHGYMYLERLDPAGFFNPSYADAAPGGEPIESFLLSKGYALAGSAYGGIGWNVEEGIEDTLAITHYFKKNICKPNKVILYGQSMGSVVSLRIAEKHHLYDAVITGCSLSAGTSTLFDAIGGLSLAYDVALGWPASWGTVQDVRDDIDFYVDVLPVLIGNLTDPNNIGKLEFIRLVSGLPLDGFYDGSQWFVNDMYFSTAGRAELQVRAGGSVVDNTYHNYTLPAEAKAYLASIGVNADDLLAQMNARRDMTRDHRVSKYLKRYSDFKGKPKVPVLQIQNITDGMASTWHNTLYRENVESAGRGDKLVQAYADLNYHCRNNPDQIHTMITAAENWVDTGMAPDPASFPASLGFVPGYQSEPYPFTVK